MPGGLHARLCHAFLVILDFKLGTVRLFLAKFLLCTTRQKANAFQ